jgi:hypothetical protein
MKQKIKKLKALKSHNINNSNNSNPTLCHTNKDDEFNLLESAIVETKLFVKNHILKKLNKYEENKLDSKYVNKNKITIGVIHTEDTFNSVKYIQCPLLGKNYKNLDDIDIGVCESFGIKENTKSNRRLLATHKWRYHCDCKDISKIILLKADTSIQDVLKDKIAKKLKNNKKNSLSRLRKIKANVNTFYTNKCNFIKSDGTGKVFFINDNY